MNDAEWTRRFVHPYADISKAAGTHGHLKPTSVKIPPYATFVVPFAWMLQSEQKAIDERLPTPIPPDDESPFKSPWVFGRARQEAILNLFSSRLTPQHSLVFFYCKEGQPLGDTISRLVMGVGKITTVTPPKAFEVNENKPTHLMWDLLIRHWLSAAMGPNTSEDFSDPDTPVNTVILRFGMSSETFLRLFSRAPRMMIDP